MVFLCHQNAYHHFEEKITIYRLLFLAPNGVFKLGIHLLSHSLTHSHLALRQIPEYLIEQSLILRRILEIEEDLVDRV